MRPLLFCTLLMLAGTACAHTHSNPNGIRILNCDKEQLHIDDGDTIHCNGERIRILGIDTPEVKHPDHGQDEDQPYGPEAATLAHKLIDKARQVKVLAKGTDIYGRTLGHVLVDGRLFGVEMVAAGLAYETISRFGDNGFGGFAALILEAAANAPKPKFENPREWRRSHRLEED